MVKLSFAPVEGRNYWRLPARRSYVRSHRLPISSTTILSGTRVQVLRLPGSWLGGTGTGRMQRAKNAGRPIRGLQRTSLGFCRLIEIVDMQEDGCAVMVSESRDFHNSPGGGSRFEQVSGGPVSRAPRIEPLSSSTLVFANAILATEMRVDENQTRRSDVKTLWEYKNLKPVAYPGSNQPFAEHGKGKLSFSVATDSCLSCHPRTFSSR